MSVHSARSDVAAQLSAAQQFFALPVAIFYILVCFCVLDSIFESKFKQVNSEGQGGLLLLSLKIF